MTGRNSRYYSSLLQGGSRPLISLECGDRAGCHGELIVATAPDFFRREGFLYVGRYAGTFQHLLSPGPVLNDRQGDSIPIPSLNAFAPVSRPGVFTPTSVANLFSEANPATISLALAECSFANSTVFP